MFGLKKLLRGNSVGMPKELVERLKTPPKFTPDGAELQNRKHNLVLLYGNEMNGGRDTNVEVKPLYKDVFTADPFVMVKVRQGEKVAPVVLPPPELLMRTKKTKVYAYDSIPKAIGGSHLTRLPPAPIKGELYQLTDGEVESLDKHYENTVVFDRIRVKVRVEHYAISKHDHEARISEPLFFGKRVFMYVARLEALARMTVSLNSIQLYKHREHNQIYEPRYYYSPQDWK